ncbi:MAG: hypothetical protein FWG45_05570 [Oscillospiraceae bacterium]|nr:hypothetical protein [Oscillospiraceae bacterium]
MLNNIEQLEKEIAEFQGNLSSSNELLTIMRTTANAVSKHNNALSEQLIALQKTVTDAPEEIRGDYDAMRAGFGELKSMFDSYVKVLDDAVSGIMDLPAKVDENNTELAKKALTKIVDIQTIYAGELRESQEKFATDISEYKSHIAGIHDTFKATSDELAGILRANHDDFAKFAESADLQDLSGGQSLERVLAACGDIQAKLSELQARADTGGRRRSDDVDTSVKVDKLQLEIEGWRNWETQSRQGELSRVEALRTELAEWRAQVGNTLSTITAKLDALSAVSERLDVQREDTQSDTPKIGGKLVPVYIGMGLIAALVVVLHFI